MKWISDIKKMKGEKRISMVTCYDSAFAKIVSRTKVDMILIGDSIAMTLYGFDSTLHATTEMMLRHTEAVRRGAPEKFIVTDMPFDAVRQGETYAFKVAADLIRSGANAVKIEGYGHYRNIIATLIASGIPVMGHLGLMPQSVNQIGGYKVQGRDEISSTKLLADAESLESLGVFALVLECVPADLAVSVTEELSIPTIGIGAGVATDGQVLVMHDLLGMDCDFNPKFVKQYVSLSELIEAAFNDYAFDVERAYFPTEAHVYD